MKGKKLSSYDPMTLGGAFTSLLRMTESQTFRETAINTKGKDFTVDTVIAPETHFWETGIESKRFNDNEWVIVDEYRSKKEATIGHKKWVKYMESNPKTLKDIHISRVYKSK